MTRKKLFSRAGYLVGGIFALNMLADLFFWYDTIWWFDILMHFLGGLFVSMLIIWLFYQMFVRFPKRIVFLYVVLGVLIIALSWELFEFSVWTVFDLKEIIDMQDSIADVVMGCLGSVLGAQYFLNRRLQMQLAPTTEQYGTK